jgi:hypothetical protein
MFNFFGGKKKPNPPRRGPERRAEARLDVTVDGEWRFKPSGKIAGSWSKVVITDLSRLGAGTTVDREFKLQDVIEVRMTFEAAQVVTIDASITRCEKVGGKFKVGLAFRHVNEESSHIITRFVNKRMTELRGRGLV